MHGTLGILMISLLILGADPALAKPKEDKPSPAELVKEGKILVVRGLHGGEPQLTDEEGKRFLIVGELREEALRLEGHKLKAWGIPAGKKLMVPTLKVRRYEILESGGGRRPVVGLLRKDAPLAFVLERKEGGNLEIKGSKPFLELLDKHTGCKVWLVGDLEGKALKAFKYGWLSCKVAPKEIKGKENKK